MEYPSSVMPELRLEPGTDLPGLDAGPLTLGDFVRWAGYQENWLRVHYDRAYATQRGFRDCIQSGHHRTALLTRMITDWLGGRGRLVRLAVRHAAPVFPGDSIRCGGRILAASVAGARGLTVDLEVWAIRQDGQVASEGTAAATIASDDSPSVSR